jgi:hypothetical protein
MSADGPLTPRQSDDLRAMPTSWRPLVIPASMEFDVPGADDPAIQGRDADLVRGALDELARVTDAPRHRDLNFR